jgi:hypothetical protein
MSAVVAHSNDKTIRWARQLARALVDLQQHGEVVWIYLERP